MKKWVVDDVDESAYDDIIPMLISTVKATSFGIPHAFSICDYHKCQALYCSESWNQYFRGISRSPFVLYDEILSCINPIGNKLDIDSVDTCAKSFIDRQPQEDKLNYVLSARLNFIIDHKKYQFHWKSIPLLLSKSGKLWIEMDIVYPSTVAQKEEYIIENMHTHERYVLNKSTKKWILKHNTVALAPQEKEVLILSIQGHSISSIAQLLSVTVDCIKTRRRKLFEKLGVGSIQEAITYAMNMGLL